MQNLFQLFAYIFGGKKWIKWDMVQGLKMAIFVNEIEIDMFKRTYNEAVAKKEQLEKDLQALIDTPLPKALDTMENTEGLDETSRVVREAQKVINEERKNQVDQFNSKIKSAEQEIQMADGELSRTYSIAYSNRRKYDFVRNYKVKATYADKK